MIKVVFKNDREEGYGLTEFTYSNYPNAQVNDIVVVNTRYGFAIAKVVKIDIEDERFSSNNLATVYKVIKSADEIKQEIEKIEKIEKLKQKIKRNKMLKHIEAAGIDEEEMELIKELTDDELNSFLIDL